MWNARIPEHPIALDQVNLWLALNTEEIVQMGISTTFAKWDREGSQMDEQYLIRYASKTMNNEKSRRRAARTTTQKESHDVPQRL
jgi:hypothetical protein